MDPESNGVILRPESERLSIEQKDILLTPAAKETEKAHSETTPMSRATEEAIAAVPLAYNSLDGHEVSRKKDEGPSKEPNSGSQTYPYQGIWDRTYKPRPNDPSRHDPTYTHKELKIKCRSIVEVKNFEEKGTLPPNISAKARKKVEEFQAKRREEQKKTVEKILKDAWNTLMHCYDDEESQWIDSEETCPADDI